MDSFIDGGFFQFFLLFFFFCSSFRAYYLTRRWQFLFYRRRCASTVRGGETLSIVFVWNVFMFRACLFILRPLQFLYNSIILVKVYKYDNNVIVFNRANKIENNRSSVKYIYIYIFMLLTSKTKNETRSSKRVSPRIKVKTIIRIISFPCKM